MQGKLIGWGTTAEIYEWPQGRVIKLFYPHISLAFCRHEFRVMQEMNRLGLRAPQVYELIEYEGRNGIVYERIEGQTLLRSMLYAPWSIPRRAKQFARLQLQLQCPTKARLPVLKTRLAHAMERATLFTPRQKQELLRQIEALPDGDILCHFDFHLNNIICAPNGLIAVDWPNACIAVPAADAARTSLILQCGKMLGSSAARRMVIRLFRGLVRRIYVREYCRASGAAREEIERWIVPIAAYRLTMNIPDSERKMLQKKIAAQLNQMDIPSASNGSTGFAG